MSDVEKQLLSVLLPQIQETYDQQEAAVQQLLQWVRRQQAWRLQDNRELYQWYLEAQQWTRSWTEPPSVVVVANLWQAVCAWGTWDGALASPPPRPPRDHPRWTATLQQGGTVPSDPVKTWLGAWKVFVQHYYQQKLAPVWLETHLNALVDLNEARFFHAASDDRSGPDGWSVQRVANVLSWAWFDWAADRPVVQLAFQRDDVKPNDLFLSLRNLAVATSGSQQPRWGGPPTTALNWLQWRQHCLVPWVESWPDWSPSEAWARVPDQAALKRWWRRPLPLHPERGLVWPSDPSQRWAVVIWTTFWLLTLPGPLTFPRLSV